jgi:hypothetical protein
VKSLSSNPAKFKSNQKSKKFYVFGKALRFTAKVAKSSTRFPNPATFGDSAKSYPNVTPQACDSLDSCRFCRFRVGCCRIWLLVPNFTCFLRILSGCCSLTDCCRFRSGCRFVPVAGMLACCRSCRFADLASSPNSVGFSKIPAGCCWWVNCPSSGC